MTEPTERHQTAAVHTMMKFALRCTRENDFHGDASPEIAEALAAAEEFGRRAERERCAAIADEYADEVLPVDPGGVARLIAGRVRQLAHDEAISLARKEGRREERER